MPTDAQFPLSADLFADKGLVYWIDSSARQIISTHFTEAQHSVVAKLPPGYQTYFDYMNLKQLHIIIIIIIIDVIIEKVTMYLFMQH